MGFYAALGPNRPFSPEIVKNTGLRRGISGHSRAISPRLRSDLPPARAGGPVCVAPERQVSQIAAKLRSVFALARAGGPVSPDPGRQVSQIAAKLPSHPARLVPAPPAGPSGGPGGLRGSVWSSRLKGNVSFRKSYRYFTMMRRSARPDRPRRPRPAARFGVPPSILAAVDGDAKGRGLEGFCSPHGICGGFCKPAFDSGLECAAAPPSGRKK